MSNPVLELSGICKSYGPALEVLRGADLALCAGEITALIAPSGAGKSTLLHIAGLLDTADAGEIRLNGSKIDARNPAERTRIRREEIGFIYQFHHLLPEFSALENIVLPQSANGVARKEAFARAMQLLERLGLGARAHHRPAELSGGEQQRVAFCRALANAPQILLADEPTGNLDPQNADVVFDAILEMMRETGLAALIATHNMDLAKRMDHIVTLEDGRLVPRAHGAL